MYICHPGTEPLPSNSPSNILKRSDLWVPATCMCPAVRFSQLVCICHGPHWASSPSSLNFSLSFAHGLHRCIGERQKEALVGGEVVSGQVRESVLRSKMSQTWITWVLFKAPPRLKLLLCSLHCGSLEMLKHLSHRKIACLESGSSPKSKPKNSEQVPFKKKILFWKPNYRSQRWK